MADGSHMCIKNWADFPAAARVSPRAISMFFVAMDMIGSKFHVP